jgi:hypothetical protein
MARRPRSGEPGYGAGVLVAITVRRWLSEKENVTSIQKPYTSSDGAGFA